jgi:hypothetical protein
MQAMRPLMPLLVALAATAAGLAIARLRADARAAPAPTRLVAGVAAAMGAVGVVLLAIGWWAWDHAPAGSSPALVASVAYVGASVELFFAAMLAPSALRAVSSPNPSARARRR